MVISLVITCGFLLMYKMQIRPIPTYNYSVFFFGTIYLNISKLMHFYKEKVEVKKNSFQASKPQR